MYRITLNRTLAKKVSVHFFALYFWCIGIASTLAVISTAKWYMVGFAAVVSTGGWFVLYKFEEGLWKANLTKYK